MQFESLPQTAHALVTLRPIAAADIPVWYDILSTPAVFEHTSWNVRSPDELAHYAWSPAAREPSALVRFAIALRSNNQLIGTAGFHTVSHQNRTAELAYDLAQPFWGKGIATHVCGLLTSWAHTSARLIRVQATVLSSNERSAKVLQRCGFEREGLLRSYRLVRGQPGDFVLYSHVTSGEAT